MKKVLGHMPSDPVAVSKFFKAKESWTKKPAWWFDLSIKKVKNNIQGIYYLVGKAKKKSGFIVLEVPNKFLADKLKRKRFEIRYKDAIRLHLTAEGKNKFVDERGKGKVNFSRFLIHPKNTKH